MIKAKRDYFSDILRSFFVYHSENGHKYFEKTKEDLGNSGIEIISEIRNADNVLVLRDYELKITFNKSFLSKFGEVENAEKKVKKMIKKVNQNTYVFCGTLTNEEKEVKKLIESLIKKNDCIQKKRTEQKKISQKPKKELSIYFKKLEQEKELKPLIENEKNIPKISNTNDDFDADIDILPDELFV